jgi:pimeloyl-ACP methyl ester carboxylesterase
MAMPAFSQQLNQASLNQTQMEKKINSKTIVFVHGLFLNHHSWADWKSYFEGQGYTCYAPAYPYKNHTPSSLWDNTPSELGKLTFKDVVESMEQLIDTLPEKPIIIGHSMGGLVAQKLVEIDKAAAAICISSAAPNGVTTSRWSFWKSNFRVINHLKGNSIFKPTKKWFHYAFANTLAREVSDQFFDKYVTPESRNIPRSTLKSFAKIDFNKNHAPLLFITGGEDHIIPSALVQKNFKKYKEKAGFKELKVYKNRNHLICLEKGSDKVASDVLNWIKH